MAVAFAVDAKGAQPDEQILELKNGDLVAPSIGAINCFPDRIG